MTLFPPKMERRFEITGRFAIKFTFPHTFPTDVYGLTETGSRHSTAKIRLVLHCAAISALAPPSPPLDNIRVMVIVWRLRGNIIRTALCWVV